METTTSNQILTEENPLLKERKSSLLCRSNRLIYLFGVAATISICIFLFYSSNKQQPQLQHDVIINKEDDSSERVLYTDNPSDYLCDPDFLYSMNAEPEQYIFASLDEAGVMQCDTGFTLKCVVSASYGNAAGNPSEVVEAPYGCGFKYEDGDVSCTDGFECSGEHDGEVDECLDELAAELVTTTNPCVDCVPLCGCGSSSPQFYNVADCFGDKESYACLGVEEDTKPNLYLPQSVWDDYCYGENVCYLELANEHTTECGGPYFKSITASNDAVEEKTVVLTSTGYSNNDVLELYVDECADMNLKILAVCESD